VVERLDASATPASEDADEDEEEVAGPIAIAVDVSEGGAASDNPAP
jgi:exoribonuclease-2